MNSTVKWGASIYRFGSKFDHGLVSIKWAWRLRACKVKPKPDYSSMTDENWRQFDVKLTENLLEGLSEEQLRVSNTQDSLFEQHAHIAGSIAQTIEQVVPPKKTHKINGRRVSERTRGLYKQRVRDFNTGRKVTSADRKAWNRVLNDSAKRDYQEWVASWVEKIEEADKVGDTRAIYQAVKVLAGKTKNFSQTQPTKNSQGQVIHDHEELTEVWRDFLSGKFSATEIEQAREEFADLPPRPAEGEDDDLKEEEFLRAVQGMKLNKAPGPDGVPAEVWRNSEVAKAELFFFLRHVWRNECVPRNLVLCVFIMIYKKGSSEDCANYRAIGLLNHAYKVLSKCILQRLIKETDWFLSEWQAGFRAGRGCRDNVLLLRVIYDNIIRLKKRCVVTYIDFAAAFDSVSHKYLDLALMKAGASRKTRAMFRQIYQAAAGTARVLGLDGKHVYSHTFDIARGVIQGDIISPIFFVLALDQLVQTFDTDGEGVCVGKIKDLRVLGYADDAALLSYTVDEMTQRLTKFADGAKENADMRVKLKKTFSHIVQAAPNTGKATVDEISKVERKFKFPCDFEGAGCTARFKTRGAMRTHRAHCTFNYERTATVKKFFVKSIRAVFGHKQRRLFLVSWFDQIDTHPVSTPPDTRSPWGKT